MIRNLKYRFFVVLLLFWATQLICMTVSAQDKQSGRRIYALAVPFLTLTDEISFEHLTDIWNATTDENRIFDSVLLPDEYRTEVCTIFGTEPSENVIAVSLPNALREAQALQIPVILAFEDLNPLWKTLAIDQDSPLKNTFDPDGWSLTAYIQIDQDTEPENWTETPILNRNADKLTVLTLTGVTALVRGTAAYMDVIGPRYPASLIREKLVSADILHINNEVPFAEKCNQTEQEYDSLRFCSKSHYIELLTDIGADVIELDGDHFQDFGDEAVLYTLDLYDQHNIRYYGGGRNITDAQRALIWEHNGNRFAFLGCNGKDVGYAAASDIRPGAVHCDIPLITEQIRQLKKDGFLPILTLQHVEVYKVEPTDDLYRDFQTLRNAGAVIVSGSQSHIPMSFDLYSDAFVHYGLGNLFFDQAFFLPETSESLIDRHTFYDGKYIGTEFLTIKFTNLALSRFTTPDERIQILSRIFADSEVWEQ